jgi:hypothetical protein
MRSRPATRRAILGVVVTLVLTSSLVALVSPAAAAAEPTVSLVPATDEVGVDETTTVDVVVHGASSGVGAYNATLSVDDRTEITAVSVGGDAGLERVDIAADGSSALVVAALMDTAENPDAPVTIATLTIRGVGDGESDVDLRMTELVDEGGGIYAVDTAEGGSVRVVDRSAAVTAVPGGAATTPDPAEPSGSAGADGGEDGDGDVGDGDATEGTAPAADAADTTDGPAADESRATPASSDAESPTRFGTGFDVGTVVGAVDAVGWPLGLVAAVALCLALAAGVVIGRRQ